LAVGILVVVAVPLYYQWSVIPQASRLGQITQEAVNDHLRILQSESPLEVKSGGMHQVKPWFEGRLDFAPVVRFDGDQEFQLQGGAVGYFLDRKAAVFVYKTRLHTISLFVFRSDGFSWPTRGLKPMGEVHVSSEVVRGFNVLIWRADELGYALVSDLNSTELFQLGLKLNSSS